MMKDTTSHARHWLVSLYVQINYSLVCFTKTFRLRKYIFQTIPDQTISDQTRGVSRLESGMIDPASLSVLLFVLDCANIRICHLCRSVPLKMCGPKTARHRLTFLQVF